MDPASPGAYEWWYFDALSEDGRWALVLIFFLGSPMSPYYKAAAAGKRPDPRDWCGVFVSVHEVCGRRVTERAYAYNLYRGGDFRKEGPGAAVGGSRMSAICGEDGWRWRLAVDEPGLWRGRTRVDLTFTGAGASAPFPGDGNDAGATHTWVCVAPRCQAEGRFTLPSGRTVLFRGAGYHDHNFGRLPFDDTRVWYWGRASFRQDGEGFTAIFYHLEDPQGEPDTTLLVFAEQEPAPVFAARNAVGVLCDPRRSPYGLTHARRLDFGAAGPRRTGGEEGDGGDDGFVVFLHDRGGTLSEGPFYRRLLLSLRANVQAAGQRTLRIEDSEGIGEVFQPARLCGPIVSRAMWSRIRRRSNGSAS